jgi:hypothetical protein
VGRSDPALKLSVQSRLANHELWGVLGTAAVVCLCLVVGAFARVVGQRSLSRAVLQGIGQHQWRLQECVLCRISYPLGSVPASNATHDILHIDAQVSLHLLIEVAKVI